MDIRALLKQGSSLEELEQSLLDLDSEFDFKCRHCGKCCKNQDTVLFTARDIYNIAKKLGKTTEHVIQECGEVSIGYSSRIPLVHMVPIGPQRRCPLLRDDGRCSVHDCKPTACALFPVGRVASIEGVLDKNMEVTKDCVKVRYVLNDFNCGSAKRHNTIRSWLARFQIPEEDDFFLVYGDNVIEKHGINRDRTGDREKTRYLCGKQGIFTRDRALIRPGSIRQLETRASTRSSSFFHALGGPGRPYNGGGAAGAYRTHNGAKPLKQGHLRAKRGPLGPSRKSQQQTKRTGFAAHGHSIAETASEGKRASRANGALNRAKINGRGQKQGFGGVDRRRGGVTSCYSRRYDDGGDRAITGGKCGKAILHFPHSRVEL